LQLKHKIKRIQPLFNTKGAWFPDLYHFLGHPKSEDIFFTKNLLNSSPVLFFIASAGFFMVITYKFSGGFFPQLS